MPGCSAKPLAQKLDIGPQSRVVVDGVAVDYAQLVAPLPDGVTMQPAVDASTDIVHLFCTSKADLASALKRILRRLRSDTAIWVSWPKKASKVATDLTENVIRDEALPLGLVDIKVCAVDEVWSGLKLVVRREKRK